MVGDERWALVSLQSRNKGPHCSSALLVVYPEVLEIGKPGLILDVPLNPGMQGPGVQVVRNEKVWGVFDDDLVRFCQEPVLLSEVEGFLSLPEKFIGFGTAISAFIDYTISGEELGPDPGLNEGVRDVIGVEVGVFLP